MVDALARTGQPGRIPAPGIFRDFFKLRPAPFRFAERCYEASLLIGTRDREMALILIDKIGKGQIASCHASAAKKIQLLEQLMA